jgi:hypothetical protein
METRIILRQCEQKLQVDTGGTQDDYTRNIDVRNNICYTLVQTLGADEGTVSNNIQYSTLTGPEQAALYTDASNDDFTLSGTSEALDYGVDLGFLKDLLGNTRNVGASPDAGAYERQ